MIMPQTRVRVADNTGARELMCIRVVAGGSKFEASVGDVIVASVKEATPGGSVKKGEVVKAVIVRQAKEYGGPTAPTSASTTTPPSSCRTRTTPRARASSARLPASCANATT